MRKKKEDIKIDFYEIQNKLFKDRIEGIKEKCTQRGFTEEQKKDILSKINSTDPIKKRYMVGCFLQLLTKRIEVLK